MSSLSWETFYNTDYAGLDDAASIWKQYIAAAAEIETALIEDIPVLKEGAGDQERDDFDGETADQVRGHMRRICNQFLDDVDAYAGRIQALLEEAKSGFEGKRADLADLFSEKNVYLTAKGGPGEEHFEVDESSLYNYLSGTGSFQPMNEFEANDYEQRVREQAVDMSDRFKSLMDDVRALDDDLAAAFKALNDDAPALPPYIGASFEAKTAEYLQSCTRTCWTGSSRARRPRRRSTSGGTPCPKATKRCSPTTCPNWSARLTASPPMTATPPTGSSSTRSSPDSAPLSTTTSSRSKPSSRRCAPTVSSTSKAAIAGH